MKINEVVGGEYLVEMPYLHDEELGYQVLAKVSTHALRRSYTKFAHTKDVIIFSNNGATGFIAGYLRNSELSVVVKISSRINSYPVEPTQLLNYQQISMVNVSNEFNNQGNTKAVYSQITKKISLVSDHEQYLGAKGLWKSLARESDINVYVFDGNRRDYIRNLNGEIVKYNGQNIKEESIWGQSSNHRLVLLVATVDELK
jgi:hypothetical protein